MNVPQPKDGMTFTGTSDGHNVTYDFTRLGVRYVTHYGKNPKNLQEEH